MLVKRAWLPNFHRKSLVTLFLAYVALVSVVTLAILAVYAALLPATLAESIDLLKRTISASFNLSGYKEATPTPFKDNPSLLVMVILFAHAFSILVLNMIFQAVVTAKLIKPNIDLRLSAGAVFRPKYGLKQTPHALFRLVNASAFDLHLVSLKVFLTVHDERADPTHSMTYYFPVPDVDPLEIPVLRTLSPWIVAIPVSEKLSNSLIPDYEWRIPEPAGSHPGKRQLEVLVSGQETEASTSFLRAFELSLEADGPNGLMCGTFESLPCTMNRKALDSINRRMLRSNADCGNCAHLSCRYRCASHA